MTIPLSTIETATKTTMKTIPLDELNPGQAATIRQVRGPASARRRMLEMGLVKGETITMQRSAPLGDPVAYTVKGYHLSLRRRDAANVDVEVSASS